MEIGGRRHHTRPTALRGYVSHNFCSLHWVMCDMWDSDMLVLIFSFPKSFQMQCVDILGQREIGRWVYNGGESDPMHGG